MSISVQDVSDDELVLKKSALLGWAFGSIFFVMGLVGGLLVGEKSTLRCERASFASPSPSCVLVRQGTLPLAPKERHIRELQGAYLDSRTDSEGGKTYWVGLKTEQGSMGLTSTRSSARSHYASQVTELERFLRDKSQRELTLIHDDRFSGLGIGGVFSLVGLGFLLLTSFGTIRLSIPDDEVEFDTRTLLWRKVPVRIPLSKIEAATVEWSTGDKGGRTYRVALVKVDGSTVPLTHVYSSGSGGKEKVAQAIRRLLAARPRYDESSLRASAGVKSLATEQGEEVDMWTTDSPVEDSWESSEESLNQPW